MDRSDWLVTAHDATTARVVHRKIVRNALLSDLERALPDWLEAVQAINNLPEFPTVTVEPLVEAAKPATAVVFG